MKKIISILLACFLILLSVGCAKQNLKFEIAGAERITVFSGSTGKTVEITDAEDIEYITNDICSHSFTKGKSCKNYEGYAYELVWYGEDGHVLETVIIQNASRIRYDGYFYDKEACNCELCVDYIESRFETEAD